MAAGLATWRACWQRSDTMRPGRSQVLCLVALWLPPVEAADGWYKPIAGAPQYVTEYEGAALTRRRRRHLELFLRRISESN